VANKIGREITPTRDWGVGSTEVSQSHAARVTGAGARETRSSFNPGYGDGRSAET